MKRVLIALILCLVSIAGFNQEWNIIGMRINQVQYENEKNLDYETFYKRDSIYGISMFKVERPKISQYVYTNYIKAHKTYKTGLGFVVVGGLSAIAGSILFMASATGVISYKAYLPATILTSTGGAFIGTGITISLVTQNRKYSCNISAYKDYNIYNY